MTHPRRNIYPMDASDPNLRWCNTCDFPYMPAGGCKVHVGRCLTCCAADHLDCMTKALDGLTEQMRECGGAFEKAAASAHDLAQIQADIDALYGKDGER